MQAREPLLAALAAAILIPRLHAEDPALSAWLIAIAESQLSARTTAISQITNAAQAEQRKMAVRSRILEQVLGHRENAGAIIDLPEFGPRG